MGAIYHEDLEVYCNDAPVGVLTRESDGIRTQYTFAYHEGLTEDAVVSLTMPMVEPVYGPSYNLHRAFEVSLPEGWIARRLSDQFGKGIRLSDAFAMLRLIGRNPIGRLTFGGPRTEHTLEENLLASIVSGHGPGWVNEVIALAGPDNLGVSGVGPKLLLSHQDRSTFRLDNAILKLEGQNQHGIALAEEFALSASRAAGIPTVEAHRSETGEALFVDRFDIDESGVRLGFEDACALNGFPTSQKYDGCLERLFSMVEGFVSDEHIDQDKETLLRIVLLNDILRNGDAHLKNFGLLYRSLEDVRLAPSYDVLDTTLYLPSDFPALTINQYYPGEAAQHKRWLDQAGLDELLDVADIPLCNIREAYRELESSVMESIQRYGQDIHNDPRITLDRKRFVTYMLEKVKARLRYEGPLPLGRYWATGLPKDDDLPEPPRDEPDPGSGQACD